MEKELIRLQLMMRWLINGIGIHCIHPTLWRRITPEWIEQHYNVNFNQQSINQNTEQK